MPETKIQNFSIAILKNFFFSKLSRRWKVTLLISKTFQNPYGPCKYKNLKICTHKVMIVLLVDRRGVWMSLCITASGLIWKGASCKQIQSQVRAASRSKVRSELQADPKSGASCEQIQSQVRAARRATVWCELRAKSEINAIFVKRLWSNNYKSLESWNQKPYRRGTWGISYLPWKRLCPQILENLFNFQMVEKW